MAITNGYATLAEYKAYHTIDSTDPTDDRVIEDLIEAASRHFDVECGQRTFYGRTETRYFDVPPGRFLRLDDDLISVTTLTNGDGTVLTTADYYLHPRNAAPYWEIRLKETSTYTWQSDTSGNYEGAISVLGSWGYAASAPKNVYVATLEIAKALYSRRTGENMNMIARVTAAGVVMMPAGTPDWVADVIAGYRKKI